LAKDVKYKVNLEKFLKYDIGYIDIKNIRISPDYLQQNKKTIFAMIRQLGLPTFLITFTSAEHCWDPLVSVVSDSHRNRKCKKQTDTLENNDIDYLIRKDPVTCTRYYRHRINALRQLICHNETFFKKISNYFFVTEFQNRGNEHDRALLWIEGAPVYGADNNSQIEQFVGKYITCNTYHLDPELAKVHRHYHTRSCRKRKNAHCRYNFLMSPMRATRIIEPLSLEDNVVVEKSKSLFAFLEQGDFDELMNFDDFWTELNLSEDEYIQVIQCTLKQPTIFLKRKLFFFFFCK
jgi:hypothetical protein